MAVVGAAKGVCLRDLVMILFAPEEDFSVVRQFAIHF